MNSPGLCESDGYRTDVLVTLTMAQAFCFRMQWSVEHEYFQSFTLMDSRPRQCGGMIVVQMEPFAEWSSFERMT
jgi:hypothetical protein